MIYELKFYITMDFEQINLNLGQYQVVVDNNKKYVAYVLKY